MALMSRGTASPAVTEPLDAVVASVPVQPRQLAENGATAV
jgi:hypothetical protein